MTPIDLDDLELPPVVHLNDQLAEAVTRLRAQGARWGVVVDEAERLHGWVGADAVGGGLVRDRARRMEAWVPARASLKAAFSAMLQEDAGWVAVLDGERFLGVLTPRALHEALRRSVEADLRGVDPADVELASIP